jgi:hypothetical protein
VFVVLTEEKKNPTFNQEKKKQENGLQIQQNSSSFPFSFAPSLFLKKEWFFLVTTT